MKDMMEKLIIATSTFFLITSLNAINVNDDPYSIERNIGLIQQASTTARNQAIGKLLKEHGQKKQGLESKLAENETDKRALLLGKTKALQEYKQACEELKIKYDAENAKLCESLKEKEQEFTELDFEKNKVQELIDFITNAQNAEDFLLTLDKDAIAKQMKKESPRGPQESTIEYTQRQLAQTLFNFTGTISNLRSLIYPENTGQ
jgi:LPS O-antigen subunit length determinant protein (WzzB/FepE family)